MEWVLIVLAAVYGLSSGEVHLSGAPTPLNSTLLPLKSTVTVVCYTDRADTTVSWYKKWTNFGKDTLESVCGSKRHPSVACASTGGNSTMNITSLEERDGGIYSCGDGNDTKSFNFSVSANASVTVHVTRFPSYSTYQCEPLFELREEYYLYWEWRNSTGTVNLTSPATNVTDHGFEWGGEGNSSVVANHTGSDPATEGRLACNIRLVKSKMLLCREVPLKAMYVEFAGPKGDRTAIMGDSMPSLVCKFLPRGDAALNGVRWSFQNKTGNASTMIGSCSPSKNPQCQVSPGSRYKLQLDVADDNQDRTMTSTLEIVDFGERDDGNYTCEVEDEFGPGSFVTVYVRGIDRFSAVWIFVGLGITAVVLTLMVVAYLRRRKQRNVPEASSRPRVVVTETKFVQRSEM